MAECSPGTPWGSFGTAGPCGVAHLNVFRKFWISLSGRPVSLAGRPLVAHWAPTFETGRPLSETGRPVVAHFPPTGRPLSENHFFRHTPKYITPLAPPSQRAPVVCPETTRPCMRGRPLSEIVPKRIAHLAKLGAHWSPSGRPLVAHSLKSKIFGTRRDVPPRTVPACQRTPRGCPETTRPCVLTLANLRS